MFILKVLELDKPTPSFDPCPNVVPPQDLALGGSGRLSQLRIELPLLQVLSKTDISKNAQEIVRWSREPVQLEQASSTTRSGEAFTFHIQIFRALRNAPSRRASSRSRATPGRFHRAGRRVVKDSDGRREARRAIS
jgi:hypothetical protein